MSDDRIEFDEDFLATVDEMYALLSRYEEPYIEAAKQIGNKIGFGRLMQISQASWRNILAEQNIAGGEFAIGPCVQMTVPCECELPHKCDWCCGSGWLTRYVKEVKDKLDKA